MTCNEFIYKNKISISYIYKKSICFKILSLYITIVYKQFQLNSHIMIYLKTNRIPSIIFTTQLLALKIEELKIKILCSNSLSVISKLESKILMALKISNLIFKSNKII